MTAKAIQYAEETLGVHSVWQELAQILDRLNTVRAERVKHLRRKAMCEEMIEDREQLLISEEWGKHPDMAQTRMDKHIKGVFNSDKDLRELRTGLQTEATAGEVIDAEIKHLEGASRALTARMNELGGYFQYLAAVKLERVTAADKASNPTNPTQPTQPSNPTEQEQGT